MKLIEKKLVETDIVSDIICDICGGTCNTEYGHEFMQLSANWGFMSNKDLEEWTAQICEKCVDDKFSFVKFTKRNVIGGNKINQ